jgi:penicillin-binding protein 1B
LDKVTNRLATPACPEGYYVAFIAGTEPKQTCEQSFADHRNFFSKILGLGSPEVAPPPTTNGPVQAPATSATVAPQEPGAQPGGNPPGEQKKKKGFFGRLFGGKGSNQDQNANSGPPPEDKGNKSPPQ